MQSKYIYISYEACISMEVEMFKILFVINTLAAIIALFFWVKGLNTLKNDEYNIKGIRYILLSTNVTGICIVLTAIIL